MVSGMVTAITTPMRFTEGFAPGFVNLAVGESGALTELLFSDEVGAMPFERRSRASPEAARLGIGISRRHPHSLSEVRIRVQIYLDSGTDSASATSVGFAASGCE